MKATIHSSFSTVAERRTLRAPPPIAREGDEELLRRCRASDRKAFHALVVRHRSGVFALALRMVGRREDAEDLTQETFLRAFHSIADFRGDCPLSSWMYRICRNLCRNHLEWNARRHPLAVMPDELPSRRPGVMELLVTHEQRQEVDEALSRLPEDFREVLILRHTHQMSYEEMAEVLDMPVGTIRSRLHRGRDQLRTVLRPQEGDCP